MKYDSGPPTATLANTTHRLRQLLETRPARGAKDERIRELHRNLRAYADQHPLAHRFMLDAQGNHSTVWHYEWAPDGAIVDRRAAAATESERAATELVALRSDVDSYMLASMIAILVGNLGRARHHLTEGLDAHGATGYGAWFLNQAGLVAQIEGRAQESLELYKRGSESPVAGARRSALASGAFAAASIGGNEESDWFLQRMGDEDAIDQLGLFDRIAQLRCNRLGRASVEKSQQALRHRASQLSGAPDWACMPRVESPKPPLLER